MKLNNICRACGLFAFVLYVLSPTAAFAQTGRDRQRFDADWRFWLDDTVRANHNDVESWMWRPLKDGVNTESPTVAEATSASGDGQFNAAKAGDDVFHGRVGFCLFEAQLRADFGRSRGGVLHFESVDDNATVYVNGRRILRHEGWNDPFDLPLTGIKNGDRFTVDVVVENTNGPGGIGATSFQTVESSATPPQAASGFHDASWRTVHLPHDFVIEGKFASDGDPGHGSLPRGVGWYRKSFAVPKSAKGKSVWIDFDGAFSDSRVWLNGKLLGTHRSGYTGFSYDLSRSLRFGAKNEIAVRCDARKTEGWWYEGGGLYRHVWLTIANPVHIAPLGGVFVTTRVPDARSHDPVAEIIVTTTLAKVGVRRLPQCEIVNTVLRPDGSRVGVPVRTPVALGSGQLSTTRISDAHARLWSLENPQLYKVRTEIYVGGRMVDRVTTKFGVRTIRFDANRGFLLNEVPVKLKGTCNHQDFVGVGTGMADSVLDWRIAKLKEMGSNAYRCSHNEVATELLDACDRQGMLVMDENREFGDTFTGKANERTTTNDVSDLTQEVLRDRNHPCVIMWSLANEEFSVQATPAGGRIARALAAVVRKLDPTRPVTAALNGGHGYGMSHALDLEGFNYNPGEYESYHKANPYHPMFASETASTVTTRGEYVNDPVRGYVKSYDSDGINTAQAAWEPIAREPYNAGGFVWTGFDYKGEPSPYGWPCVNSHFGIVDMCGFPKDNFYYYKAWWGTKPSVHIEPNWNWAGKEGQPIAVWIFGNGDTVELSLNGRSLGSKQMPKYRHAEWSVPYEAGELVAKSYVGGKLVATDRVSTTGEPVALVATTTRRSLNADSEDCAMIEVRTVDAQGRTVPTASNLVQFSASGPAWIAGVGNGDPSCHEPDRAATRHAFHGLCLGIVQARDRAGAITVTVSSPGLKSAILKFTGEPSRLWRRN